MFNPGDRVVYRRQEGARYPSWPKLDGKCGTIIRDDHPTYVVNFDGELRYVYFEELAAVDPLEELSLL